MSSREQVDRLVREIGADLGVPLALDRDGTAVLGYGGGFVCTLAVSDSHGAVALASPLCGVHAGTRTPLFEAALRLNLYGADTGDHGVIGYDADRRELVLNRQHEAAGLDKEGLAALLNGFMDTADELRSRLATAERDWVPLATPRHAAPGLRDDDPRASARDEIGRFVQFRA